MYIILNADIFDAQSTSCPQDLRAMAPIHAHEKDRSVGREIAYFAKCAGQEILEFIAGHFAGCHGEFAMLDEPGAAGVSIDPDVVRGVGKHHPSTVMRENRLIRTAFKR